VKILLFDDFRLGVLVDDHVIDVSEVAEGIPHAHPQDIMNRLIADWGTYRGLIEAELTRGPAIPLHQVRVRPPLPRPTNIDCMARNYMENGTLPERPPINAFTKTPNSVIGHGDTMILPDVAATVFEAEAELAVVIGRYADNVPADEAMDYVFGYTNLIDGSARGIPPRQNAFYQMKSRGTFCPIGPYIMTADEIPDPQNLPIRLWNNGTLMQDFNTNDMAYSIVESLAFISSVHPLEPGDIIATGTNHRGLHPLMDGDVLELEVGPLSRLRVDIRDALGRTWARETRLERAEVGLEGVSPQLTGKYAPAQGAEPD
jgi:2-keto-4-pentenoate hydratase/2-oxohepta-3-ene-1,7-dioic acid hydratase in catechol pathway